MRPFLALLAACALLAAACEGEGGGAPDGGTDAATSRDGGIGDAAPGDAPARPPDGTPDGAPDGEGTAAPLPSLTIAFEGGGRFPDNLEEGDTWLVATDGGGAPRSASALVRAAGGPAAGCAHGCVFGDDGRVAVAAGPVAAGSGAVWHLATPDGAGGWTFAAPPIDAATVVRFAGEDVVYSRPTAGAQGVYELRRRRVADAADDTLLFPFPPADFVAGSLYRGAFHVSADGATIALDRPTSRSRWLFVWRRGDAAATHVDTACWQTLPGTDSCVGASAFYSGDTPIALSGDGADVVWFVVSDGRLEARHLDLDADRRRTGVLTRVPEGGDWLRDACAAREAWQPTDVVGRPHLVDGGAAVLFVGAADCGDKPETDVYALPLDRLGDDVALAADDLDNLTQLPRTGGPEQLVVTDLAVDPTESVLVFTATPAVTAAGAPIPAGSSRHHKDTEVWVQRRGGGERRQLTDDARFTAERPRIFDSP